MAEVLTSQVPAAQLFRDAFDSSPIGIAVENLEGQPLFVNPAFCRFLGFTEKELRSKHCVDFSPPEDARKDWELFQQLKAGSIDHYQLEKRYLRRDGSLVWGRLNISLLRSHAFPLVIALVEDITDKKNAEEELRSSEERLRLAAEVGKMYAFSWDLTTDEVVRSPEYVNVLGVTDQLRSTRQQLLEKLHPEDRVRWSASPADMTPDNPNARITYRQLRPDGTEVWLEKNARAFFDSKGKMVRVIGMVADVTERKRAEEAIRASEAQFRTMIETTNEGVWLLDSKLHTSYVNSQMAEMLGCEPTETIGRSVFDFYFAEDVGHKKEVLSRRQQGLREQREERLRRKDGTELWVRMAATPLFKDNGEFDGALAMMGDITERKRAEETLRESEERFHNVFQDAGVGMVIVSPEGRFLAANKAFCDTLGYTEDELLEKTVESITFHEDWPAFSNKLREALRERSGFQWVEKRCLHKSGRIVHTESSTSLILNREGNPQYFVGEVLDITKRKQVEEALSGMTRKLIEAHEQERTRIGRELHDDINQRLALLSLDLQQLENNPSQAQTHAREIRKELDEISSDVEALSHELHSSKLQYLGVLAGIKSWCRDVAERQRLEIDFRDDVSSAIPYDVGISLFRVLQEAVHNAMKYSGVKRIEIEIREHGSAIHLMIRDSGRGFDVESAMHGKGLGLTSMRERVRLINGTISIDSQPLHGTTIQVRVPLKAEHESEKLAG